MHRSRLTSTAACLLFCCLLAVHPVSPVRAEQYVCLLPVESPVTGMQSFECELPGDVRSIVEIRVSWSGEFDGTTWLCNLETPDPFAGPGGLALAVSGVADDDSPISARTWTAPLGVFEESWAAPPPSEEGWDFLLQEGRVRVVLEDYVPESWDCHERCPHGCSDVSGFGDLTALQLSVDYVVAVPNGAASWGTLKASW